MADGRPGRPRTPSTLLALAVEYYQAGRSLRSAARLAGVSPRSLKRHLDGDLPPERATELAPLSPR